jgi:hypothetical protein
MIIVMSDANYPITCQRIATKNLLLASVLTLVGVLLGNERAFSKASTVPIAPQQEPGTNPSDPTAPKLGQFYDKQLDLHFDYPVEMRVLDARADMERGHQNIYGVSGDNDPEHQAAIRCMRPLLDLELPQEKAPQRPADVGDMWVDDTQAYKDSRKPEPILAKIFLAEFVKDCLPSKVRKNENDTLGNIALTAVSEPGIQRMPHPIWYEIAKQKIHMNSGMGRPIVNGKLADAPIIVMAMATQWRGHLLAWMFTSNDAEIFNEITKSQVEFGDGPWGPMFAANIGPKGSGTPMTILPK